MTLSPAAQKVLAECRDCPVCEMCISHGYCGLYGCGQGKDATQLKLEVA